MNIQAAKPLFLFPIATCLFLGEICHFFFAEDAGICRCLPTPKATKKDFKASSYSILPVLQNQHKTSALIGEIFSQKTLLPDQEQLWLHSHNLLGFHSSLSVSIFVSLSSISMSTYISTYTVSIYFCVYSYINTCVCLYLQLCIHTHIQLCIHIYTYLYQVLIQKKVPQTARWMVLHEI